MFGFKSMITGSPVTISSNELEPMRFDSISKASTSTGISYVTLLYAEKNSKDRVKSNGKDYKIIYHWLKCLTVISKGDLVYLARESESVSAVKPLTLLQKKI